MRKKTKSEIADTKTAVQKEEHTLSVDESHFFLGNRFYYENHDYVKAVAEYKQAAEEEKDELIRLKATYMLAESYVKMGKIEDARSTFETIAKDYKEHYLKDSARRRAEKLSEYTGGVS